MKGYNEITGLYETRYYANKEKAANEVVVKVDGGYRVMTITEHSEWKKQK